MRREVIRILCAFLLGVIAFFVGMYSSVYSAVFYVFAYLIVGYDIVLEAVKHILKGKMLDECFLMTIATMGAFFVGEFPEAVAVMLFYKVGELFQDCAVEESRKSVAKLMDIRPDYANVLRKKQMVKVSPDEVLIGDTIVVKPGEKIPLDGVVLKGESMLNTMALTGESLPKKVKVGDTVLSGCINQEGTIEIEVTKEFGESTVQKILELIEHASERKSKSEHFIHKFAKYYTPIVVLIALLLVILPPLMIQGIALSDFVYRALSFLVVSCPCALVLSIPLSFFAGIGRASKCGILMKGSNYLETLARSEVVVCDKTGTLTEGSFRVRKIEASSVSKEEVLKYAAYAESFSNHPIAVSWREAYGKTIDQTLVTKEKEFSGKGVYAKVDHHDVFVGNEKLFQEKKIKIPKQQEDGTLVYVAVDGNYIGMILIADQIKKDAKKAIVGLRKQGIRKIVMLTGDNQQISQKIASKLQLDECYAELLPQDKVSFMEQLMKEKQENRTFLFVGDGINDAPVLALSDVGVAMGGLGSDAAIEAADVVLMEDEPSKLVEAIEISKRTMRIVKENIIFAILVKIFILALSTFGFASMWMAVFADVGVSILAVLNALRLLRM